MCLRFFKLCKNQSFETNTFTQSNNNLVRLLFRKLACTGFYQGGRKEGRGNEPVGSCAMYDARSTGSRALEGKNH